MVFVKVYVLCIPGPFGVSLNGLRMVRSETHVVPFVDPRSNNSLGLYEGNVGLYVLIRHFVMTVGLGSWSPIHVPETVDIYNNIRYFKMN